MTATSTPATTNPVRPGRNVWRVVLMIVVLGFAAFWTWALFFASKDAVNKFADRAWAERAQAICENADERREALADYREVDEDDPAMVAERGDVVDRATDVVEEMLDEVMAVLPADAKGADLVPQWAADYRTHIEDRRRFADVLRTGDNVPFTETAVDGIPLSDKLEVFAGDNEMPACAPPHDLSF